MLGTGLGVYLPIALYVGVLIGCLLSIMWRPTIGLYILVLIMPQQRLRSHVSDMPLGYHLITLLLLAVLLGALIKGQLVRRSPLNKLLIVFGAFMFLSLCLGSFYPSISAPLLERLLHWKDYMLLPGLFFATSAVIRSRRQMTILLVLVCLSILLVDRGVALEVRTHDFAHFDENKRDSGPLGYAGSNGVAAFEAQMSLFLLALVSSVKKRTTKLLLYGLIALSVYCLLFSFSRGAYIGFLAGLIALALLRRPILLPILLVLFLAWQIFLPRAVVERISMTEDQSGELEDSAASRVELWKDALDLIAANPVLGSGYDTYEYMGRVRTLRDTHNYYVKMMVETGIIGLCIYLAIIAKFFQIAWGLFRRTQDSIFSSLGLGMVLCTVCIAAVNFFGDRWTYIEVNGLVWVLVGLLAYAHHELDSADLTAASETSVPTMSATVLERTLS